MSGDPEQEYFADGMVEEIITALVGRELGVRYVLEGSVAKGREPRAHHRPAHRRHLRCSSLG
jgi:TolB-like protein